LRAVWLAQFAASMRLCKLIDTNFHCNKPKMHLYKTWSITHKLSLLFFPLFRYHLTMHNYIQKDFLSFIASILNTLQRSRYYFLSKSAWKRFKESPKNFTAILVFGPYLSDIKMLHTYVLYVFTIGSRTILYINDNRVSVNLRNYTFFYKCISNLFSVIVILL